MNKWGKNLNVNKNYCWEQKWILSLVLILADEILSLRFAGGMFQFFILWWAYDDWDAVRLKRKNERLILVLAWYSWVTDLKDIHVEIKSLWIVG